MDSSTVEIDLLFETSWEVCNKIGGIYTVLSTKAKTLQRLYKDKVIFIGPDVWTDDNPSPDFCESATFLKKWRDSVCLPHGVSVRVGRWNVPGRPIAVLVRFGGMYDVKNEFYGRMWRQYGVDSLHAYGDYDEACAFSHAAGVVIESIVRYCGMADRRVVAHFDEWTTGMGLLYVKSAIPSVATVFTTHATSIGRSICGNGKPLYGYLAGYDGDQMSRELNMESKHSLEKAAACNADCFTTVSDVTALECGQLLGRRPDVVTPNGFERNFVPARSELAAARAAARSRMIDVASALVGSRLPEDIFIVVTSGRCEYRNKGIDLFLDAVARAGDSDPSRKILAFVMVPAWPKSFRRDLAHSVSLKRYDRLPDPVITHELNNPSEDPINSRIHSIGFSNDAASRVMVVYVPCYLDGNDGIFNMSYYGLLAGVDATVFPSYYEPWGYTPLESVAFGVPTVTTSLSGFGQWVLSSSGNGFDCSGVKVEDRTDFNYDQVKEAIASDLKSLVEAGPARIAAIGKSAMATADAASWQGFIGCYSEAFSMALDKSARRRNTGM